MHSLLPFSTLPRETLAAMRRLLPLAVAAVALACATSALAAPIFVVNGRGWGHGIGMSQYGAYGFARSGWTYDRILAHYYRGTQLAAAPGRQVRVLLEDGRGQLTVTAATVSDASGTYNLAPGPHVVGPALRVTTAAGAQKDLSSPAEFDGSVKLGQRAYRGSLVVHSAGGSLSAVNHVGLEAYLYGVVPWEMPPSWAAEALKAQAVAARSYALVSVRGGGSFDLYDDTRSQVYGGIAAEDNRTNAAINATAGRVVSWNGAVAHTFFHSTSGGRTATITDVWPSAQRLPYLVSVQDPHDSLSPYHRWGPIVLGGKEVSSRLRAAAPSGLFDLRVTVNGSGRVARVRARGTGGTSEMLGSAFQSALGLRSTWFSIGVLSLKSDRTRLVFGDRVVLAGVARGVGRVILQRRPFGGSWRPVGVLAPSADGQFAVAVRPRTTMLYRLVAGRVTSGPRRIFVAARVRLSPYRGGGALAGFVRPARAGAAVEIQRRTAAGAWRTVASTRTNASGRFRAQLRVVSGTYRARATLGRGVVPGTSPALEVAAG
jgi:stage II sporulation protein D